MPAFLDIDAPDTAWRPGSEDPIPVLLGRHSVTAFSYRFLTGRPLDGHARTNATFWHAGTKPLTRSGHTQPYNYWPGWKRGLLMTRLPAFGLLPYSALIELNEATDLTSAWWLQQRGHLVWLPLIGYAGSQTVDYLRTRSHRRDYLNPIERAAIGVLRTRDRVRADIPRGLVRAKDITATGRLYLPPEFAGHEGDRDQLLSIVRDRLGAQELDANFNLEGRSPHMELYVPAQPPKLVADWEQMTAAADPISPYLGQTASGAINWKLGDDSPHIAIVGDSGSGKSELAAWIVAQFMRGGAGVVVLDPKYASHKWLLNVPGVLYCSERRQNHDTILWLDEELARRGRASRSSDDEFPRIVVLLEERNSMQTLLRELWTEIKPPGAGASPALAALNRLTSQGRALGITVMLAGQETAEQKIGSRASFGSFAISGRMGANHWRTVMGAGARKPAISGLPGRFGYVVAGQVSVFQSAYPNLKNERVRLLDWAMAGEPILDVQALLYQQESAPFPSSEPGTAPTEVHTTLSQFAVLNQVDREWLRSRSARDRNFPASIGRGAQNANLYREDDLAIWLANSGGTSNDQ